MQIYNYAADYFSAMPDVASWDELQSLFHQAVSRKPNHWLMPIRACRAVGGLQEQAIPAVVAIGCAHVGILLVDDMLDGDPRGDYHRIGMPAASNMSCAFQAAALQAVSQCVQDPSLRLVALSSFNEMYLSTAFGQFLDVKTPADEDAYWQTTQAKSSPFFGVALQVGALAGGAALETAEQLKTIGGLYGEMIQIHDDLHDTMEIPANPDWIQGRSPLPIIFAQVVEHPDQARFMELYRNISDDGALQEAQEILIRCGGISYCVDQLIRRHKKAQRILNATPLVQREVVASLLDEVIAPIQKLLEQCNS
jgi:geranylgeranyl pyrophosphate synthase